MIMPSEAQQELAVITTSELCKAGYQFAVPFILELEQGEFIGEQVVRLIPGRRMVVFGTWRGMPVVAKLFYDKRHALRHYAADLTGVKSMMGYKIPSPTLRYEGKSADQRSCVLIFERLSSAANLEELWMTRESDESVIPVLHALMVELATQHVLGVRQRDMHLGNFLLSGKAIITLDGAQIEIQKTMLERQESIENIALLLSQLGAGVETLQHSLFLHYAKARGWLLKSADMTAVLLQIKKNDNERWQRFSKKIFRHSTEFTPVRRFGSRGMVRREMAGAEMKGFLQHPDNVFANAKAVVLKNGRSSTVIRVTLDGRDLVIKRYNMKNIWHRLRRLFRVTRAEHSWRLAQKLQLFNVKTPIPVAYLESNVAGMRGKSYYVSEYVAGENIKDYLTPYEKEPYRAANVIQRVCKLIATLARLEMTHGDLKATNIIVDDNDQPYLIDLDGALEHYSLSGLRKASRVEIQRFMRNFEELPAISEVLRRSLQLG